MNSGKNRILAAEPYLPIKSRWGNSLQFNAGTEAQKGFFNTKDFGNKAGVADSLQLDNNINLWQYMIFAQADVKLPYGFIITAGVSFNRSSVQFINLLSRPSSTQQRSFENKLPPHLAILKKITTMFLFMAV